MRKILLSIGVLTSVLSLGQAPILTTSNINGIGTSQTYYVADSNATNLDAITGMGITWDYSTLQGYANTVDNTILDATTAANAADFPTSVFADELQGNFMIYENQVADSIFAQGYTFSEPTVGDVLVQLSTDELKIMHYPFTYPDSFTDSLSGTADITGGIPVSGTYTGNVTTVADGYGTLLLGTNSYSDILRVKIVESSVADLGFLGSIPLVRTQYNYYQPSTQNFPIFMHTSLEAAGTIQTIVYSKDPLSIIGVQEENLVTEVSLYPNPGRGQLNLAINSAADLESFIEIRDLLGKTIEKRSENLTKGANRMQLNIEHLVSGIYLVHIDSGNSQLTKRFVVE